METYGTDVENPSDSMSMSTLNEMERDEENYGSEDEDEVYKRHWRQKRAYINKFLLMKYRIISLFFNTVDLENALTYEMTTLQASRNAE